MRHFALIISPQAVADLNDIYDRIAERNPLNAERFLRKLCDQIDSLKLLPDRHGFAPEAKHVGERLRQVTVWPYRIVYRVGEETVEVVTVRHGFRRPFR